MSTMYRPCEDEARRSRSFLPREPAFDYTRLAPVSYEDGAGENSMTDIPYTTEYYGVITCLSEREGPWLWSRLWSLVSRLSSPFLVTCLVTCLLYWPHKAPRRGKPRGPDQAHWNAARRRIHGRYHDIFLPALECGCVSAQKDNPIEATLSQTAGTTAAEHTEKTEERISRRALSPV